MELWILDKFGDRGEEGENESTPADKLGPAPGGVGKKSRR